MGFGRSTPPGPPEDPRVSLVESMLGAVASADDSRWWEDRPRVVARALWICACVTQDDAPTWLLHDAPTTGLSWCRIPDGVQPTEMVRARELAGGHADPGEVVRWLRGEAPDPWSNGGWGFDDGGVLEKLRSRTGDG